MRFVVKVGTRLVADEQNRLNGVFLRELTDQLASLFDEGHEVVLVSSGAVAAGRNEISFDREKKNIPYRQVLAAVGQSLLMSTYHSLFHAYKIPVAQALLTNYDFFNRENFLNTQRVFEALLKKRVIPVVNENDVTTMAELRFGDNDLLAAKTAAMISADMLILLTTVDGLFTDDPGKNPKAKHIDFVEDITDEILDFARIPVKAGSMGGMLSKLQAAEYAVSSGIPVCIVNGRRTNVIREIIKKFALFLQDERSVDRFPGTFFRPAETKEQSFKKWMKPKIIRGAKILVDHGCRKVLSRHGSSLLPAGIKSSEGDFIRGDVVEVFDLKGEKLGYGQTNYGSEELQKIGGKKSSDIEKCLGYAYEDEVIHRDRLVLL